MTTNEHLAEIKARAENTTSPGPWDYRPRRPGLGSVYYRDPVLSKDYPVPGCGHCGKNDSVYETGDGEFIAASRTDVPALVAALEAVLEATSKRHGPEVSQQYEMAMESIEDIINEALGGGPKGTGT